MTRTLWIVRKRETTSSTIGAGLCLQISPRA
jgi:hypothetical protein